MMANKPTNTMNTPTPRLDERKASFALNTIRQLERELATVTEQRDRLAGGLKWIAGWNHQLFDENTAMQMRDKAEQALQSLNQGHSVATNDMIADVKGGNHES